MNSPIIAYRANMGVQTTAPFTNTYSLDYDGVDDFVSAPQSFLNSASTFSMSLWAKKPTAADTLNIGSRLAVYQGMWLNWYSDSNVYFLVRGGANESISFSLPFDTDWHHFLCTFNNGLANVYVDGILKATQTFTAVVTPPTTGDNFRIGSLDASNFGNSTIDEVALWDSVVPIGDVWDGSGAATDLSLLATPPLSWYRNGDNGAYKSPQWLIPSSENKDKVSNYSFQFDGINDYINIGNGISFEYTDAFSFSTWVKPLAKSGVKYLYSKYLGGKGILIYLNSSSSSGINTLHFNLYNTVSGTPSSRKWITTNVSGLLSVNDWANIIVTYDGSGLGSGISFYKNGIAQTVSVTYDNLQNNSIVNTEDAYLSSYNGTSSFLSGNQDEFAIFNTELSSADALAIYNSGEPTTLPSGAVSHYKMGEEANFTSNWLVDNSALDNYSKRSFSFDGIDDFIDCGDITELDNTTTASWSMWANSNITSSYHNLISCYSTGFNQYLVRQYSTRLEVYISQSSGTLRLMNKSNFSFTAGTWFHIAIIYDESEASNADKVKVYIDGVLQSNTVAGFALTSMNTSNGNATEIGKVGGFTTKQYNGNIDEVAIFDSAISIGDVWDGSGEPIDVSAVSGIVSNYRMGEDASFNGTNWTVPDNVGSNTGTSANMTVDDLVGEAPNYSGGGISSGMTIEDRVGEAPNSENNALSFNMELVDRTTNVPT